MIAKTVNQRKADERARKRKAGLVKLELWVKKSHVKKIQKFSISLQRGNHGKSI